MRDGGTPNVAGMLCILVSEIAQCVLETTFLVKRDDAVVSRIVAHGDHRRSVDLKTGQGLITAGPDIVDVDPPGVPLSHCQL